MLDMAHGIVGQEHAIQALRDRLEAGSAIDFKDEIIALRELFDEGCFDAMEQHLDTIESDLALGNRTDSRLKQLSEASARLTAQQKAVAEVHYAARNVLSPDDARTLVTRLTEIVAEETDRHVAAKIIERLSQELAIGGSDEPAGGRKALEAG